MFDRRLRVLVAAFALAGIAIILRLGQLQVVRANYYRDRAAQSLVQKAEWLPFVRGSILDRTGHVLVSDEPCWDITVDYSVIAAFSSADPQVWRELTRSWRRRFRPPTPSEGGTIESLFRDAVHASWIELDAWERSRPRPSPDDVYDRARSIQARVQSVRETVAARRGFDAPVAEETQRHAIIAGLAPDEQIAARERLSQFPWIHLEPSSQRRFHGDVTPLAHILGGMGRVTAEDVARDPHVDDPFAAYRADESRGISGIEWSAESRLRGRRGRITVDLDGSVIPGEDIAAEHGQDVTLTIHAPLQDRLHKLLTDTVRGVAASSGGAIVVVDVPTRDVLALVSVPSYDPVHFDELYASLRDDTQRLPLRFRAVSNRYAPGSTVKPLICLVGLINHAITLDSREECRGFLLDDQPDRWRCWQVHGTSIRKAHGDIDVVGALTGSCNIFMYRLGERLGVDRLCDAFDMVGIGRASGIGLKEEDVGINPTTSWLSTNKNLTVTAGNARLFAIGQGELALTPVQLANLMATYANGKYRPLRLVQQQDPQPEWVLPVSREQWRAIRRGMYGVVNDPDGTAYEHAHFIHDRYALVGKTGSATAYPWPTAYRMSFTDEFGVRLTALVPAGTQNQAVERFTSEHPDAVLDADSVEVATKWPPGEPLDGENHSHAWFGGFLQELGGGGEPDWSREPRIAFVALVEFGGSGSRITGPLAKEIAATLLHVLGPELQPDAQRD